MRHEIDQMNAKTMALIRAATSDDAGAIRTIYAPFVAQTAVSFEEDVPSIAEMTRRIRDSHAWLVCEGADVIRGYAYATQFRPRSAYRWSAEVSVYIDGASRGQGLGRALVGELLLRLEAMGFVNAFAGTTLPNPGSIRLFESFGFTKIAHWDRVGYKLGRWHDVGWWQLQLRPATTPPPNLHR